MYSFSIGSKEKAMLLKVERLYREAINQAKNGITSSKTSYFIDAQGKDVILTDEDFNKSVYKLNTMQHIHKVDYEGFDPNIKNPKLKQQMNAIFDGHGNVAINPINGKVELNRSSVKNDLGHKNYELKKASINAIIPTIEQGEIIEVTKANQTGKKFDSVLIEAPIKFDDGFGLENNRAYLLARIHQDNVSNKFYLHDVSLKSLNKKDEAFTFTGLTYDYGHNASSANASPTK